MDMSERDIPLTTADLAEAYYTEAMASVQDLLDHTAGTTTRTSFRYAPSETRELCGANLRNLLL